MLAFWFAQEDEIVRLRRELLDGSYRPGQYRAFVIHEPKRRVISAAPFRDRVVHHAVCQVIEPIFERTFLGHSYANRRGYGTHRALRRFTGLLRDHEWVLRGDIRQFFPSLDHQLLKREIRRKVKCLPTLALLDRILDGSNEQEPMDRPWFAGDGLLAPIERRRGLPIGNLTSQFLANVYLNPLDHFVVEQCGQGAYVRYVDDFAVFGDDPGELRELRDRIGQVLLGLRLRLHPAKTQVHRTAVGSSFVGFHVLPGRVRVRQENLARARMRLRGYAAAYAAGSLSLADAEQRVRCWVAHMEHGDTWRVRRQVLSRIRWLRRLPGEKEPGAR